MRQWLALLDSTSGHASDTQSCTEEVLPAAEKVTSSPRTPTQNEESKVGAAVEAQHTNREEDVAMVDETDWNHQISCLPATTTAVNGMTATNDDILPSMADPAD